MNTSSHQIPVDRDQVAALPVMTDGAGQLRVLLVTSRDTRRWVLPKGWEMKGKKPWRAAEIEARQEAGVKGQILQKKLGQYHYWKTYADKEPIFCRVSIYPLLVTKMKKNWKERDQRDRCWFSFASAASKVHEPELKVLLDDLSGTAIVEIEQSYS
jgi:8-oxo-dGTP pyrophosphatase MutT (NUDIX family)